MSLCVLLHHRLRLSPDIYFASYSPVMGHVGVESNIGVLDSRAATDTLALHVAWIKVGHGGRHARSSIPDLRVTVHVHRLFKPKTRAHLRVVLSSVVFRGSLLWRFHDSDVAEINRTSYNLVYVSVFYAE